MDVGPCSQKGDRFMGKEMNWVLLGYRYSTQLGFLNLGEARKRNHVPSQAIVTATLFINICSTMSLIGQGTCWQLCSLWKQMSAFCHPRFLWGPRRLAQPTVT